MFPFTKNTHFENYINPIGMKQELLEKSTEIHLFVKLNVNFKNHTAERDIPIIFS